MSEPHQHGHGAHDHHGHHHDGHDRGGHDGGGHDEGVPAPAERPGAFWLRLSVAGAVVLAVGTAACLVQVRSGEATVVSRFGNPVRVLTEPGLALRWPAPFESVGVVDLRLHTTSSGLQDVGTKDGLRIIVQAYAGWQVAPDPASVQRFLRAVGNQPDQAAAQIRSFVGSALETAASGFNLSDLINTDPAKVRLDGFEGKVAEGIGAQLLDTYGVRLAQVGVERVTLPAMTLSATIERMRAERETIATERTAEGRRRAAEIRSAATRDARIVQADASVKAADIQAEAMASAAKIYAEAYSGSPQLYELLRSLDTLGAVVNSGTRLVLRTDALPFRLLTDGPPSVPPEGSGAVGGTASIPGEDEPR